MSDDPRALERLMARVDSALAGHLTHDELAELSAHLDECKACEREIERVRLIRHLLQNSCPRQAPPSLRERIEIVTSEYRSRSTGVTYSRTHITTRRELS